MLSIKTAHDSGHLFGDAELSAFEDELAKFRCSCGEEFTKRKYKPYTDAMRNMMCALCRHKSRVQPFQAERQILRRVRDDAKTRSLAFELEIDWFAETIHLPCHYCGSINMNSSLVIINKPNGDSFKTPYKYNGVDRMDNTIGYVEDNCVPCCFICNRAKREMGYDEFMKWLDSMMMYRGGTR